MGTYEWQRVGAFVPRAWHLVSVGLLRLLAFSSGACGPEQCSMSRSPLVPALTQVCDEAGNLVAYTKDPMALVPTRVPRLV